MMNENEIIIHDLNGCDLSDRNGTYGRFKRRGCL